MHTICCQGFIIWKHKEEQHQQFLTLSSNLNLMNINDSLTALGQAMATELNSMGIADLAYFIILLTKEHTNRDSIE